MRRTSFVGALTAIAVGAILTFAIRSTPGSFDLQATGLIVMAAGVLDLVIRFMIADSPLLSPQAAAVAAVVEPIGEPLLDALGNPIVPTAAPTARIAAPGVAMTSAAAAPSAAPPAAPLLDSATAQGAVARDIAAAASAHDHAVYDQALRSVGRADVTPESDVPVGTIGGRPVRTRRRRRLAP